MTQINAAKRPAEIVRDYIEAEFLRPQAKPVSRLPTIQEFSNHLNVSSSTVRSVFKALAKEGRLDTIPGKGTFLVSSPTTEVPARQNCIGVNAPEGPPEGWWGAIFLGVTSEALKANMMVTALGSIRKADSAQLNARQAISRVDGVIAFPDLGHAHEIDKVCREVSLPLIHINPTHFHATSNFVSNDFFGFAYHLALAWRETGRRKILLMMGAPVNDSVSAAHVFSAFSLAFASCPDARVEVADGSLLAQSFSGVSLEMGRFLMKNHLDKHGVGGVDAVYAFGDLLAEGAIRELLQTGCFLPKDVSVVGGTGLDTAGASLGELVTMKQPMGKIGETAAEMLIWRIQHQSQDAPGIYLMPELGEGNSVRPEERKAFQRLLLQDKELT